MVNIGLLEAFVNKKKGVGVYVKVFVLKRGKKEFYRDGYTDMTGTFKYALSDIDEITSFAILVQTDKGGVIKRVNPPSKLPTYQAKKSYGKSSLSKQKKEK